MLDILVKINHGYSAHREPISVEDYILINRNKTDIVEFVRSFLYIAYSF